MGHHLSCCYHGPESQEDLVRFARDTDSPAALSYSKNYTKVSPVIRDIFNRFLKKGPDSVSLIDLKNLKFSEIESELIAKLIPELTSLTELILINNDLGQFGMNQLTDSTSSLVKLEKLVLSQNLINDECMEMICPTLPFIKNLKIFSLSNNLITDQGAQLLAQSLNCLENIQEIDLSHNKISLRGIQAVAEQVKDISSFERLKFEGNGLRTKDVERIMKILPNSERKI
jgi:Ran GTPase-activating protein (RanGAP) involved in mRNA processing and transport